MMIIKWINNNEGFTMSILTLIYVIATIRILRENVKSTKASEMSLRQSKEIQEQAVSIELFNDRFEVYNNIKNILQRKEEIIDKPINILSGELLERYNDMNASIESLKIKYLYGDNYYQSFQEVLDLINILAVECSKIKDIHDKLKEDHHQADEKIRLFIELSEEGNMTTEKEKEFKVFFNKHTFYASIYLGGHHEHLNYYDVFKEIQELEHKISRNKEKLLEMLEKAMELPIKC